MFEVPIYDMDETGWVEFSHYEMMTQQEIDERDERIEKEIDRNIIMSTVYGLCCIIIFSSLMFLAAHIMK